MRLSQFISSIVVSKLIVWLESSFAVTPTKRGAEIWGCDLSCPFLISLGCSRCFGISLGSQRSPPAKVSDLSSSIRTGACDRTHGAPSSKGNLHSFHYMHSSAPLRALPVFKVDLCLSQQLELHSSSTSDSW